MAVKGIDIISAWDISPTVVGQGNNLNSMLIATKTFQGRETILNAYGVPVRSTEVRDFTAGVNNWQIDTRDIKPGAYFVCLQSVNGMVTKKILIQ